MARVIGVRFKKACRIYTFEVGDVDCRPGDWVVVETERGMALGQVADGPRELPEPPPQPLKKVLRAAGSRDILRYEQNCELEGYAYQFCLERIREKGLPMKLVDVEYLFDGSKAIFYFTADNRVDFRELVRELARQFHTRIEMRQIGVRDEAKMVGGIGACGRELCCATWLTDFAPISVRMAKEQDVALNPTKISGICGRLMCCLAYEHAMYRNLARGFPKLGKAVRTPRGEGKVVRRNVLEGTFVIHTGKGEVEVTVADMAEAGPQAEAPRRGPGGRRPDGARAGEAGEGKKAGAEPGRKPRSGRRRKGRRKPRGTAKTRGDNG